MNAKPPFNDLRFAEPLVQVERRDCGTIVLRSPQTLRSYPNHLGSHLRRWAAETPDATFLAERAPQGGWRRISYREMLTAVESIGQALLDRGLSAERPLMILSENSIDLAAMTLAGMYVGVPVAPVSPAYSLMSQDFGKLKTIAGLIQPGMVYAKEGDRYARALAALPAGGHEVVVSEGEVPGGKTTLFSDLLSVRPTADVGIAVDRVNPDQVAKILFTSGSTGDPKGVVTTHHMLCANQQSIAQCWPFLEDQPPLIVDWLPWSHAFGANHNFNIVLRNGGSLYIDGGKPMPGLIEKSIENLREVSPTLYFNAPRGFDMLLPYLERDEALCQSFFKNLDLIFYASAALPQNLWDRLEALSIKTRGERVRMVSSWGSSETTCTATSVYFTIEKAGVIGLPAPGVEIMLTPSANKMELRVRGPVVTPGYWKRPDLTEAAFDAEGFYRIGDAGKFDDPADPAKGIVFDGRVAEDFKLLSGTWVHCGQVRLGAITACTPAIQDAVVTGRDREDIGLLVFPNLAACRAIAGDDNLSLAEVAVHPAVRTVLRQGLERYNASHGANSMRIARATVLVEPPSIDSGEITDKGYINQRAVTERRADQVEALYAQQPDPSVLVLGEAVQPRGEACVVAA